MGRFIFGAVAAFNIMAAVLFIGCGACANVSDNRTWHVEVNKKRFEEKDLQAHLSKEVPGYPAVKIIGIVLGYGAAVGLILSAVALFFGRWWGKLVAAPIYLLAFLHHVGMIVYYLVWVNPAIEAFFTQIPRGGLFNNEVDILIKATSFTARVPSYISIAWLTVGCLYYLVATPIVLLAPTSSSTDEADDEAPSRMSRGRDEDDEEAEGRPGPRRRYDEDDDDEDDAPPRRRR